ncbi:MAG: CaiB/BaiF CoA transferase family protein [Gammaproteobacteria bacterium]
MSAPNTLPLDGIRVLDLTTTLLGPYATQILGDFGADVIKIESPHGDVTRDVGPTRTPGMGSVFLGSNRNKRSIVLDLKRPPPREALWRLIETADVFVHNMRPQKIKSLGFDPDPVLAWNPAIVYGALHGYRETGPYAGRPAYDDVIQGESGLAGAFLERDGEPKLVPSSMVDKSIGLVASAGLLAAIVQRLRTGKGLYVEVGMFEGMVGYNLVEHQYGATFVPPEGGPGYPRALSPHRRPHRTRDGHICMLAYTDRQWRSFWQLVGQPAMADDPRFTTVLERNRNIDALYAAVAAALAEKDTGEWLSLLDEAQVPVGPVNRFADLASDPHLDAIGFFRAYEHPTEGLLEIPDTAYQFGRESLPVRRHQPQLGEHTREILAEAGLSEAEQDEVMATKASQR